MSAILQEGEQDHDPQTLLGLLQDRTREALQWTASHFHLIADAECRLEREKIHFLSRPRLEVLNQIVRYHDRRTSTRDDVEDLRSVPNSAILGSGVEAAKQITRKKWPGNQTTLPPNDSMLTQTGEVRLQSQLRSAIGSDLRFFQRFCMKTVPVHSWNCWRKRKRIEGSKQAAAITVRYRPRIMSGLKMLITRRQYTADSPYSGKRHTGPKHKVETQSHAGTVASERSETFGALTKLVEPHFPEICTETED